LDQFKHLRRESDRWEKYEEKLGEMASRKIVLTCSEWIETNEQGKSRKQPAKKSNSPETCT